MVSICPLTIFVVIDKAWKKEIWDGSIPVGPGGITTSHWASCPTLAAAGIVNPSILGFNSKTGSLVKIYPHYVFKIGFKTANSSIGSSVTNSLAHAYFSCLTSSGPPTLKSTAFLKRLFFNTINSPPLSLTSLWIVLNYLAVTLANETWTTWEYLVKRL